MKRFAEQVWRRLRDFGDQCPCPSQSPGYPEGAELDKRLNCMVLIEVQGAHRFVAAQEGQTDFCHGGVFYGFVSHRPEKTGEIIEVGSRDVYHEERLF